VFSKHRCVERTHSVIKHFLVREHILVRGHILLREHILVREQILLREHILALFAVLRKRRCVLMCSL
jgi:hypothetical protein